MKPYKPSRICPHRLCPPLHTALAVTGLLAAAQVMFPSWLGWLFLVLAGLMGYAVFRPVHRQTMMDRVMQDETAQALGVHLEVRPVWAFLAASTDLLFVLICMALNAALFTDAPGASITASDFTDYGGIALGTALVFFSEYSHKMATKPRKPKRAWMPAFLRGNT